MITDVCLRKGRSVAYDVAISHQISRQKCDVVSIYLRPAHGFGCRVLALSEAWSYLSKTSDD